jgi:hypothetical protein
VATATRRKWEDLQIKYIVIVTTMLDVAQVVVQGRVQQEKQYTQQPCVLTPVPQQWLRLVCLCRPEETKTGLPRD